MVFIRQVLVLMAMTSLVTGSIRIKRGDGRLGSELNVDLIISDIDSDSNGIVSAAEYSSFFNIMDANKDNQVTRCEWTSRFVDIYDDSKLSALSSFDLFDVDRDGYVSGAEIDITGYDFNKDGRTTTEELKTGIRRESDNAKETAAFKGFKPLLSESVPAEDIKSKLKVDLIVKDVDADKDGKITRIELQTHFLANFDQDGATMGDNLTRCDFVSLSVERYDDMKDVAAVAFDDFDDNMNNYIDINDIKLSKFDENGDGILTAEEFGTSIRKYDWAAIKRVYPGATTPSPVNGVTKTTPPIAISLLISVVITSVYNM